MIIKKATYKTVNVKQLRCVSEAVYGCDECHTEIKGLPNEDSRLGMAIYREKEECAELTTFCSWDCVLKYLPKVKSNYLVAIPYLYFDNRKTDKRGGNRLIELLKRINKNGE